MAGEIEGIVIEVTKSELTKIVTFLGFFWIDLKLSKIYSFYKCCNSFLLA